MVETLMMASSTDGHPPDDREPWDAVVIGAGPAGAVAARQLALAGGRVLLIERKIFPRRKVCGACWSANGLAVLEAIGHSNPLQALRGIPLRRFHMRSRSGQFALPLPSGLAISRAAMDAWLVEQAVNKGVSFQPNTRAVVGPAAGDTRQVVLHHQEGETSTQRIIAARLVIAADGLGHPSLCQLPEFAGGAASGSRIGAGCELAEFPAEFAAGTIHMAVGRRGYVGLVVVETGQLNVAAALDATFVREQGGLGAAASAVLKEARCPEIPQLRGAGWHGTPNLTRREPRLAATRLFLIGDAAGYEEPFTGEGMTWAVISACAVEPFARRAWRKWEPVLADEWAAAYRQLLGRRQRVCRAVSSVLRSPWLVSGLTRLCSFMPSAAWPLVQWVNTPPSTQRTRYDVCDSRPGHGRAGAHDEPGRIRGAGA